MPKHFVNRLIVSGAALGSIALLVACGSSEGSGDATASGGKAASGGSAATGGGGTGGGAGTGGSAGAKCPGGPMRIVHDDVENGPFSCFPGVVCFSPGVLTPGLPFVDWAFAFRAATADGLPVARNESGVPTARVRAPEPGKVCMSGDDGAGLQLRLGGLPFWDGVTVHPQADGGELFHAKARGITAVSLTVETPPSTGLTLGFITSTGTCGAVGGAEAEQDGNPLIITSTGTHTLSFADNFAPFDTDAIGGLNFSPGPGEYDFCIENLRFLDANGDEVTP